MFKKLTIMLVVLFCMAPMVMAQTLMLEPHGVSPAQVKADTVGNPDYVGLFNRTFNGLLNVGVQTQMYLKGTLVGGTLTNPTWTVIQQPSGSAAAFGVPVTKDTATQFVTFAPDVVGTYVVEFADGGAADSVTIYAGKYLGVDDGGCRFCHGEQVNEWKMTDHSSMFTRALDGKVSSHYSASCVSCHTTGFDADAVNDGFDDFPFVLPDSLYPGQAANMANLYPAAMKRANIQCEACHGPVSEHQPNPAEPKMVSSLSTGTCAVCHDDDHYHVYPSQWKAAGHSNLPDYPGGTRTNCNGCHNGAQFIQFVNGDPITVQPHVDITCAVCHDPHRSFGDTPEDDNGRYQIRTIEATLSNSQVVVDGGNGKLCMNCHQSRQNAATYTNQPSSHFGPHYAPQADMLLATNVVTFGKMLPTSPHLAATDDACVDCHMYEKGSHGEHDEEGDLNTAGMHSFSMVSQQGEDNVAACEDCHGNIGETFDEKKFFVNGNADHDGDGTEEGLQEEVHGLMEKLEALLPDADTDTDPDSTWTLTELKAAYNHRMVYYDHSYGVHNPAFIVALLKVSIQALLNNAIEGEIVAIDDVPNDQGKQVRIIWDKFVDDGIAVDPVVTYLVKRDDGDETWTGVGQHPADGSMRYALVVPTVYDSTDMGMAMTKFKVVALTRSGRVHESMPGEGYSVDNLVPHAPGNFMAMLAAGNVDLTWEAPVDPDINYYKIYRGTDASFTPDESNMVGTTADLAFTDTPTGLGTYYYVAAAVDFSGNLGEFTSPVSATLTSVDDNGTVPLEYELSQNYPNPFNPETSIKFSLKQAGRVSLKIFNSTGQIVKTLVDQDMAAGSHNISFVADGFTSGVYIYRIMVTNGEGSQFQAVKKMILMK
jgi:hypothetical protein